VHSLQSVNDTPIDASYPQAVIASLTGFLGPWSNNGFCPSSGRVNETHLPTIAHPAQANSRFPGQDADPGWTRGHPRSSGERARAPRCLSGGVRLRPFQRLGSAAVAAALKSGRATRAQRFVLHSIANPFGYPRLALVIPKRLVKRAVDRNRIRRLAREAFRQRQAELGSRDFVLRVNRPPGQYPVTFLEVDAVFASCHDE
jgi:ribonuclease P protein component